MPTSLLYIPKKDLVVFKFSSLGEEETLGIGLISAPPHTGR